MYIIKLFLFTIVASIIAPLIVISFHKLLDALKFCERSKVVQYIFTIMISLGYVWFCMILSMIFGVLLNLF